MNTLTRPPAFIITIDTEGDDLWSRPRTITTQNSRFLPRFQQLCERHGLKPTYLTDYEMSLDPCFVAFGKRAAKDNLAEIGMHLHAWNSPPLTPLTDDDDHHQPLLMEYPHDVLYEKVNFLTHHLERIFELKMISHRAGRWAFDGNYARSLVSFGYLADCSVTPFVSWSDNLGDPKQKGGTDYTAYPDHPYFVDLADIRLPGDSPLLEVPMSIEPRIPRVLARSIRRHGAIARKVRNRLSPRWLRPNGRNLQSMLRLLNRVVDRRQRHAEFMLHSSELMPGGSPHFSGDEEIERLYADLEVLFEAAAQRFRGLTLGEFRAEFEQGEAAQVSPAGSCWSSSETERSNG